MSRRDDNKTDTQDSNAAEMRRLNGTMSIVAATQKRTRQELVSVRQELLHLTAQNKALTGRIQELISLLEIYARGKIAVADAFEQ
jgi:predicted  nucleic acid-binding Zn-ribbon protein